MRQPGRKDPQDIERKFGEQRRRKLTLFRTLSKRGNKAELIQEYIQKKHVSLLLQKMKLSNEHKN